MPESVAIVGLSCRLPGGVRRPSDLWKLLLEGRDAVTGIGPGRFNRSVFLHPRRGAEGRTYTFDAGVLDDVARFDAGFFGISPREAQQMDPQQRHLLELTWEAMESAGIPPKSLRGSDTAVYLGISAVDYGTVHLSDVAGAGPYFMSGNTLSVAANRISHAFDLRGPSLAVDTACSSSLVAFHEAHRTVAGGHAPLAVVAGVNLLLSPFPFVGFSRASMLAPDGRCRTFDARGSGYVRAEGGVVLLLKPLRQARQDGDRVLAVVRGAGANTDGHTRGIAFPSGEAQEALLRRTYAEAGVEGREVSYFEAHGTGTPVGDPVEAGAIARALSMARDPQTPLLLGSVKSNIGHLEAASGLAGVAKALLVLEHGVVPPSLHFEEPNPDIDFEGWNLRVVTRPTKLPVPGAAPLVGVNSFGFGGANAHVILEGDRVREDRPVRPSAPSGPLPSLPLSARSENALRALAGAVAQHLEGTGPAGYRDAAWTAAFRREWHPHRLLLSTPPSVAEARARLQAFADRPGGGEAEGRTPGIRHGWTPHAGPQLWVFSGNGSQWPGMLGDWLAEAPGAQRALARVDALLGPLLGWSVADLLAAPPETRDMARTEVAQPLLFALQVAMTDLLRARGVRPAAVLGHSVGEVAAAYASGGMPLAMACRVIVARSQVAARTAGLGGMAAAALSEAEAREWIREAGAEDRVVVAGENSPGSVTLSGARDTLEAMEARAREAGTFFRVLDLDYPFHTAVMDPLEGALLEALEGVDPGEGTVPFLSTVTGEALSPALLIPDYWWHNLRQPVRFRAAMASAFDLGVTGALEIGPHGILGRYMTECAEHVGVPLDVRTTARRGAPEVEGWQAAEDWAVLMGGRASLESEFPTPGALVSLPTYPWQGEDHWFEGTPERDPRVLGEEADHPLLGVRTQPDPLAWEVDLDPERLPWLADHGVGGSVVLPATGFLEMALAAAHRVEREGGTPAVAGLEIRRPLVFAEGQTRVVETRVTGTPGRITIRSRPRLQAGNWVEHAVATLVEAHRPLAPLPPLAPDEGTPFGGEDHAREAARAGLAFGPTFRTVQGGRASAEAAEGRLLPGGPHARSMDSFLLPPPLADGAFQLLLQILLRRGRSPSRGGVLPVAVAEARILSGAGEATAGRARFRRQGARSVVADFDLLNPRGEVVATLRGCRFQEVASGGERAWHEGLLRWREVGVSLRPHEAGPGADASPSTAAVAAAGSEAGVVAGLVAEGAGRGITPRVLLLAPASGEEVGRWVVHAGPGAVEWTVTHPDPQRLARIRADLPALPHLAVRAWDDPVPVDRVLPLSEAQAARPDATKAARPTSGRGEALSWVLLGEAAGAPPTASLHRHLGSQGHRVRTVTLPLGEVVEGAGWEEFLSRHRDAQRWVLTHGLTPGASALALTQGALRFAQALHALTRSHPTQLLVLVPPRSQAPEMAALGALFRTLTNELEGLEFRVLEVEGGTSPAWEAGWFDERQEVELRVGPSGGRVRRILPEADLPRTPDSRVRLRTRAPGLLDSLAWEEVSRAPLGRGELRLRVEATGLNFRDVMWSMGLLPDEAVEGGFAGAALGMECAGVVVETGPGVRRFQAGDRVLAFSSSAFSDEVVTREGAVAAIPGGLGTVEAASLPVPFFTAYYALHTLARLRKGERILLHGGAGGVGLAAIQWARFVGAEIFATVGSEPKRALLRELGVPHILHSRSLSFVDEVRARTGGEGVDVVLNSLAGEAMQASLGLLRPFGRFLELGKRDFYQNSLLAMRALRENIAYHGIDADQLMARDPARTARIFRAVMGHFARGTFTPLPVQRYEADRVGEAFRAMQQARHVGKIVVTQDPPPRSPVPRPVPFRCRARATYLVVGGVTGFGLATARWLAERGAEALLLVSRRGVPDAEGEALLGDLRARGVRVEVRSVDATDRDQVELLLASLEGWGLPPLAGVVHAAMVLDDRRALDMDPASVARVWHAKVTVARTLDQATRALPLDWTVYFSSATTLLGNPGQANYVAANAAVEALAEARSRAGFPTLALALGAIDDVGTLALNPHLKELLTRRLGAEPLRSEEALEVLGQLLARRVTGVRALLPMAWGRARRSLRVAEDGAYAWLDGAAARAVEEGDPGDFLDRVAALGPVELKALVLQLLTEQVAGVLRLPPAEVDPDRSLYDMGLDSLMTVELGVGIERQFGVQLPTMGLSEASSLRGLAARVLEALQAHDAPEGEDAEVAARAEALVARHGVAAEVEAAARGRDLHEPRGSREEGAR